MGLDELLIRLEGVKLSGSGYQAKCPAHDDRKPSLSISCEDGTILLKCFGGCATEDVVRSMGLTMADLFDDTGSRWNGKRLPPPVSELPPIDSSIVQHMHAALTSKQRNLLIEQRCLSAEVIDRYQLGFTDKFGDRRVAIPVLDVKGVCRDIRCWLPEAYRASAEAPKIFHWEKGRGSARLFPIDQLENDELVLCAGELDALALIAQDIPAITATCGEGTWPDILSNLLSGKSVTVLPDNDAAGHEGAMKRAFSLSRHGAKVKMAQWK
jgi:DNA primase